ncbi:polysaccharide biosynthesis tyrosine autokinase [Synechococcus sp. CS-1325]|uniref:polysaccharide biosynthesis tyrosine autokinase n=1 Tax=unclassified Synechococcus TaxID=2626047 RepID=UPI0021A6FA86|nr:MULTISPECIES: polysaccharide biosynthesis tyrosine autokinase [unclassified Synechococcus]MCT0198194.1 polysaccharide biosynthesis tyrosine autokinase [Synechococcus sp. CS-1325]MCT0213721.1 polysaccharide biosynthesis tyrosine autokinase [Synechococcus sp. CS-1326]MCT0234060.1 polysaccharide biosynthesis tyrosine autokinase [Synechococcus sp. CS-1327]
MSSSSDPTASSASVPGAETMPYDQGLPRPGTGTRKENDGFSIAALVKVIRRRRRPFLITVAAITLAVGVQTIYQRLQSPLYEGSFLLLISDPINDRPSSSGTGSGSGDGGTAIESLARNNFTSDVPTLIRVLESAVVLDPVFLTLVKQGVTRLPRIEVSLVPVSADKATTMLAGGVLAVRGFGSDPQTVEAGLKLTGKAYLDWALSQRQERLNEGLKFLDRQAPLLQAKSDALQADLEQFRKTNGLVVPGDEAKANRSKLDALQNQLMLQRGEASRLQAVRRDVGLGKLSARNFSIGGNKGSGVSGQDGLEANLPNQSLLDELGRLEEQIAKARALYRQDAPQLRGLIAARDQLRPLLQSKGLEAVDAALLENSNATATTRRQINDLERAFQLQPALLRSYEALRQKLDIADSNLANYLRTRELFQLEIAQRSTPWKVISPAQVNLTPVEPKVGRGLLQGLLLGLVGGAAVAVLRDRLDHVFHSPLEVRDELPDPLLGHMPYVAFFEGLRRSKRFQLDKLDGLKGGSDGYQRFYYQEAMRNLFTSLRFLKTDLPLRSLAITSSIPAEGKSLLITLLAKTLSELGQRVLVVDADMRQPQLHVRIGLDNLQGLSNLLTEEGLSWGELVLPVKGYPNWSVLTAGRRPPDPPRLLSSARMAELVNDLATCGQFDIVLYDTPPALGLADAILLGELLDGIILLVSLNKVDRSLPVETANRIRAAGAPLLGVVTNAHRPKGEKSGAYGYDYGYSRWSYSDYGYGYGTYDPASSYAQYELASAEDGDDPTSVASGQKKSPTNGHQPTGDRLRRFQARIGRWLDG